VADVEGLRPESGLTLLWLSVVALPLWRCSHATRAMARPAVTS
jgi:hypothetical protein